jgi:beta-mannanase
VRRRDLLRYAGIALGSAVLGLPPPTTAVSASPIALGAYISGAPWDPSLIDQFTQLVGVAPAIVMWYQDWAHTGVREFDPVKMDAVTSRGAMPMVTWEPWDYTLGINQPAYALRKIITGTYDAYLTQWAQAARTWGKTCYLRLAQEMNGNWFPWGYGVNGNTASQYRRMWQHVVAIFRKVGATNVRWTWSPNIGGTSASLQALYPGDSYVNWVGMDGYNWGTSQPGTTWQDLATVFGTTYSALAAMTTKPMLIAETASAEVGGNKADWITTGFLNTIVTQFPRIQAAIWFDEDKETDWRVNSSAAALGAWLQVAQSATYRGTLPS